MHSIIAEPSSRPSTADKASKHVSFGSTDTTFFHSTAPPPEMTSYPSYQAPPMERQPSPPPFEPKMVTWDPARTAPPADSEPEAKNLSVGAYQSAWDKPYNPNEPKWVPPPRSPLPKGYEYTPPAPPAESHDTSSDSEDEEMPAVKSSRYSTTSDSDTSEDKGHQQPQERINPVFPWEMRGPRPNATRVFPGDAAPNSSAKVPEERPYDRRASLDRYEFTNAYGSHLTPLILVGTPFQLCKPMSSKNLEKHPNLFRGPLPRRSSHHPWSLSQRMFLQSVVLQVPRKVNDGTQANNLTS
jgi:hypothetical protein